MRTKRRITRAAPLLGGLLLLGAIGAIGVGLSRNAQDTAAGIHADDRALVSGILTGPASQYFQWSMGEAMRVSGGDWDLRPGAERARLVKAAGDSQAFGYGARLIDPRSGAALSEASRGGTLPELSDEGHAPLLAALRAGRPGLSLLMDIGDRAVGAVGVPVRAGEGGAFFVAYFDAAATPLQSYYQRLDGTLGKTGIAYLVDAAGRAVASSRQARLGVRLVNGPGERGIEASERGFTEFDRDGVLRTAASAPLELAPGWGVVVEQDADDFFGPIRSRGAIAELSVLALLLVAMAVVVFLTHKRHRALQSAYDFKGEILANTTHELKTPVTAIRGTAATLLARWRDLSPEQVHDMLTVISRRSDGLAKLVDRILTGARYEAGHEMPQQPRPVRIADVLEETAGDLRAATTMHDFVVDAPPKVWAVVDPDALEHIVSLLVENAIKYSPEGGEIRMTASTAAGEVMVRVSDQGIGVPEGDRPHVFKPYFRGQTDGHRKPGGIGLGLAIVAELVRNSGGRIWVDGNGARGSVFAFTLPAVHPEAERPAVVRSA